MLEEPLGTHVRIYRSAEKVQSKATCGMCGLAEVLGSNPQLAQACGCIGWLSWLSSGTDHAIAQTHRGRFAPGGAYAAQTGQNIALCLLAISRACRLSGNLPFPFSGIPMRTQHC